MADLSNNYCVIGLMSGTSLDGLDVACVKFTFANSTWDYRVVSAETIPYDQQLSGKLSDSINLSKEDLSLLDLEFGKFCGETVKQFATGISERVDFVASHGHTVFHQPKKGLTLQIGNPDQIAASCGLPVVADFRTPDVALGGQGAPLVPIGDKLLFSGFDYCLNLGGFANISYDKLERRLAFDICPANMPLNKLALKAGVEYDKNGKLAASGSVDLDLLEKLESIPYYKKKPPKSLGKEWFEEVFYPIVENHIASVNDKLATVVQHVAIQIGKVLEEKNTRCLVTGGGAYNQHLIEKLKALSHAEIVLPEDEIIEFKEAIIFAFLGMLRWRNEVNVLSSVTGASKDHSSGSIHLP